MLKKMIASLAAIALVAVLAGTLHAHERRDVGKYRFVVGFSVEPAVEGIMNGVELRVTNTETQQPVEGLQNTLQVEVTHVPTGTSRTMALRAVFGEPGSYTADLIPTAPGQYRFRFFGTIEGMAVNETFESGPGRFDDVEPADELQFPQRVAQAREIEGAVRSTQDSVTRAQDMAMTAQQRASRSNTLAIVGIVLGVAGLTSGVASTAIALRKR